MKYKCVRSKVLLLRSGNISLPDTERAVCTCWDKVSFSLWVEGEIEHTVFVSLKLALLLPGGHAEHFDGSVLGRHIYWLACFVENSAIGGSKSAVKWFLLFDHTDVPNLRDTVTVSGYDFITLLNIKAVSKCKMKDLLWYWTCLCWQHCCGHRRSIRIGSCGYPTWPLSYHHYH